MGSRIELCGQRFGRLVVLGYAGPGDDARWRVRCDCGTEKTVSSKCLRRGETVSCGCYHLEATAAIAKVYNVRHGGARRGKMLAEYKSWQGMMRRCYCPTTERFPIYGGRGIRVCDRWRGKHGFAHFLEDLGLRPSPRHSLDRINNAGDYKPGNCRWATSSEQAMNRRTAHIITANGTAKHIGEWAETLGVPITTIYARLERGWNPQRAVLTPPMMRGGHLHKLKLQRGHLMPSR